MFSKINNQNLLKNSFFLGGKWYKQASTDKTYEIVNPANGETIATLPICGKSETRSAIEHAYTAFKQWKTTAKERAVLLTEWSRLIKNNLDDLAMILTTEQGKSLAEARGEILYGASFIDWFAEEGKRAYGEVIPSHRSDGRIVVLKQPIGVVGIITPWNFPQAMITRKLAPALAAGCTAVIKPAELTPLSAIALVALAEEAGFPSGVINLLMGDKNEIGNEITSSSLVRKLSFTGSTVVGKFLMEKCAQTMKKVSMELGGNAAFIVFDDADLDIAVKAAMNCKFRNTGQTCVCANRIYVQKGIFEAFMSKFTKSVEAMKVGIGTEEGVDQGPLINEQALLKIEKHVEDALSKGAELVIGGKRHQKGKQFFEPTILKKVSHDSLMCQEETFGPVAGVIGFETEEEVIEKANDTHFGLAGYFCTQNLSRAWRVAEALEVGIVGINEGIISNESSPFGGVKESGIGREGSKYGLEDFLEIKYVYMGINEKIEGS